MPAVAADAAAAAVAAAAAAVAVAGTENWDFIGGGGGLARAYPGLLGPGCMTFLMTIFWPHLGPLILQFLAWTWPHAGSQLGSMLAQVGLKLASCWLKLAQVGLMLAQVGSNWNFVRKMIEFCSKIDDFEGKLELPKRENNFKNQWIFTILQIASCVL